MDTPFPTHILVIDDDRPMQRLLADALSQQGFSVTIEQDGEWALQTFETKDFAAVVIDLHLPSINGYEVARRLREHPRGLQVPLIFMSGVYKNAQHQREGIDRFGAVGFLEKPFKLTALYGLLRAAVKDRYPEPPPSEQPAPGDAATDDLADGQAREEQSQVELAARSVTTVSSLRGDFRNQPFPQLLAELHRFRASGALLLRRDKIKKIVYFREGEPQFVKSNLLTECLGRVMVKERMISEAVCEESLRRMKASKRQQGTVLIEMGSISPANLAYALNLQLRAKLFEIFSWLQGEYQFNKRVELPTQPVNLEMSTALLIYEGVRRAYDADRLAAMLGKVDDLYVHPAAEPLYAFQDIGLGEEERWILEAADGRKTVAALRALELLPPLDTDRLLYAMKCAQVIELKPTAAPLRSTGPVVLTAPLLSGAEPPPLPGSSRRPRPSVPWGGEADAGPAGGSPLFDEVSEDVEEVEPDDILPPPPPSAALVELSLTDLAAEDREAMRERLTQKLTAMRKMDFFAILGVSRDAEGPEIEQAYQALAAEHHPDHLGESTPNELRQLASQIYDLLGYAHQTLSDAVDRDRYLQDLEESASGIRPKVGEEMGSLLAAEGKFQRGEEMLKRGLFDAAHAMFKQAVALYDQESEFHAYLGWSRFKMDPASHDATLEAIESLAKAISLNPRSEKGYLFTGYVYKATGRPELAEQQFEKAIQANPGCEEALEELSLLGVPRGGR